MKSGALKVLLCQEAGETVGCISCGAARDPAYAGWGEVVSLYVLPAFWGRGCGTVLLARAIEDLKQQGFHGVYLWVLRGNERANRFYRGQGFSSTEETCQSEIGGRTLTEERMVRL